MAKRPQSTDGSGSVASIDDSTDVKLARACARITELERALQQQLLSLGDVRRREAEESLQESEERYRTLIEMSPDCVAVHQDGRYVYMNPAGMRLFGIVAPDQIIGKNVLDLVPNEYRELVAERMRNAATGESAPPREVALLRVDGRTVEIESSNAHISWQGRPAVQIILRDISGRKRAEEALRESVEKYRKLVKYAPAAIYEMDIRGTRFLSVNDVMCDILKYSREELLSIPPASLLDPESRKKFGERVQVKLAGEEVQGNIEYRIRRKDGEWVHAAINVGAITYTKEDPPRVVVIGYDITERKRAEEALQELTRTLDAKVKDRTSELEQRATQLRALAAELAQTEDRERKRLARVLHDHLQQLLVAAKFAAGSLKGQVPDANLKMEAQRVLDLLGQSIDASRSLTMELSPPILHEAGLTAGLLWLVRWMREKHGLHVEVTTSEPPDPLPDDLRLMLFHAVRELLFNIVKHAGTQNAHVAITHDQGRMLRIVVADQGKGFEGALTDGTASGSFGLFSIRERLAFLDGRMEVESAPGQGTRITLTVPITRAAPGPHTHAPSVMVSSIHPQVVPGVIRVLIADDHTVVRKGLVELLKKEPGLVIVGEAADGQEALELVHRLSPNVVLMDVTMPRMDGIEATRRISPELPEVRVIGLSMHAEDDMAARMRAAGAVGYLMKDGPVEELVAAIRGAAEKPTMGG